jgi:hypothetical protein
MRTDHSALPVPRFFAVGAFTGRGPSRNWIRGGSPCSAFRLTPAGRDINIVGIAELFLFTHSSAFKEPFLSDFNVVHVCCDALASKRADELDQCLVVCERFVIYAKPAAYFFQQIDKLLGVDIYQVERFVHWKPEGRRALPSVDHGSVPGPLALTGIAKIAEKL